MHRRRSHSVRDVHHSRIAPDVQIAERDDRGGLGEREFSAQIDDAIGRKPFGDPMCRLSLRRATDQNRPPPSRNHPRRDGTEFLRFPPSLHDGGSGLNHNRPSPSRDSIPLTRPFEKILSHRKERRFWIETGGASCHGPGEIEERENLVGLIIVVNPVREEPAASPRIEPASHRSLRQVRNHSREVMVLLGVDDDVVVSMQSAQEPTTQAGVVADDAIDEVIGTEQTLVPSFCENLDLDFSPGFPESAQHRVEEYGIADASRPDHEHTPDVLRRRRSAPRATPLTFVCRDEGPIYGPAHGTIECLERGDLERAHVQGGRIPFRVNLSKTAAAGSLIVNDDSGSERTAQAFDASYHAHRATRGRLRDWLSPLSVWPSTSRPTTTAWVGSYLSGHRARRGDGRGRAMPPHRAAPRRSSGRAGRPRSP